ncbi:MAG TPA: MBL fold metallo-hydrolase [Thermoanaerobaculia bacterium]|nr:MBL fold metallo-hydrolase [Thermoanaerobaculia bacterium]
MYRVHLLPAEFGDAILIEYGDGDVKRILIDAGTPGSYEAVRKKIESLPKQQRVFELLVITHIDADHIGGVIPLLDDAKELGVRFKEIWFNGYQHLTDILGPAQGERLTARIVDGKYHWNTSFGEHAVVVPPDGALPSFDFDDMKITLLSPKREQLEKLEKEWAKVIEEAEVGLLPGAGATMSPEEIDDLLGEEQIDVAALARSRFKSDAAEANGSSIAFVAEFDKKSVLFGADAFPGVLAESLARMPEDERKRIAVFKLPHHGSRNNLSTDLLQLLDCKTYLISTNGKRFKHPNRESIARVIQRGGTPHLVFNYRTQFNECWDDDDLTRDHSYTVEYGEEGEVTLEL